MACRSPCVRSFPRSFVPPLPINTKAVLVLKSQRSYYTHVKAVSAPEECNEEECAPVKEVGRVSLEWVAEEKTKVTGTFPPVSKRPRPSWTGYVEKDTAGQTNIYSVEPSVYVAQSGISSGVREDSRADSQNSLAVSFGLGLIFVAGATSILVQVGKNSVVSSQEATYTGPALSYYIQKFTPVMPKAAATIAPDLTSPAVNSEVVSPMESTSGSTIPAIDIEPRDSSLVEDNLMSTSGLSEITEVPTPSEQLR